MEQCLQQKQGQRERSIRGRRVAGFRGWVPPWPCRHLPCYAPQPHPYPIAGGNPGNGSCCCCSWCLLHGGGRGRRVLWAGRNHLTGRIKLAGRILLTPALRPQSNLAGSCLAAQCSHAVVKNQLSLRVFKVINILLAHYMAVAV